MDARLARLLDRHDIEHVIHRYCRGIDRRDLALVRSCYHDDATDRHGSFFGSADEYVTWVDGCSPLPLHDPRAPSDHDRVRRRARLAAAESYGLSVHRGDPAKAHQNLATAFRYLDRFERRAGVWKIASRIAIGEWSLRLPAQAWWDVPEGHATSARDASDPLYALLAAVGGGRGVGDE